MAGPRWLDEQHAPFRHIDIVDIVGQRQAIFDRGRLEGGRAFEQRETRDESLTEHLRKIIPEHVEPVGIFGGLHADGDGEGARFIHRVGDEVGDEEPVVAGDRQPRHFRPVDRPVALVSILVIGIEQVLAHQAEALDQAPAIRDRQLILEESFGRRGPDRPFIVLLDLLGKRRSVTRPLAPLKDFGIDRGYILLPVARCRPARRISLRSLLQPLRSRGSGLHQQQRGKQPAHCYSP